MKRIIRHKKVILSAVLLLGLGLTGLQAQEALSASGGNAQGTGGSVSYSVGQVIYTTNTGTNGSVAQGVQQPFEIIVVTGLEEAEEITLTASVYPNPATDFFTLIVSNYDNANLSYQVFNMNGKLLQNEQITDNETSIVISGLATATYYVKVLENNREIKTFKIIKK